MKTTATTMRYSAKKIFTALVAALVLSFGLYSFAIASTTIRVSDSKIMNSDIQELQTEIASLESQYYLMINDLSMEQAFSEGFIEDVAVEFAHVNPTTLVAYNN